MDGEILVVFAPDLEISTKAFEADWNASADAPGEAEATYPRSVSFGIPPELIQQGVIYLSGLLTAAIVQPTLEAIAETVKERVKAMLAGTNPGAPTPEIGVEWVQDPQTGAMIAVVTKGDAP